jgi:hypothetical protein
VAALDPTASAIGARWRPCSPRISSAMLIGDSRTSSANGGLGRQLGTIARDKGRHGGAIRRVEQEGHPLDLPPVPVLD